MAEDLLLMYWSQISTPYEACAFGRHVGDVSFINQVVLMLWLTGVAIMCMIYYRKSMLRKEKSAHNEQEHLWRHCLFYFINCSHVTSYFPTVGTSQMAILFTMRTVAWNGARCNLNMNLIICNFGSLSIRTKQSA